MLSYGSFVWLRELLGDEWWKQRVVNLAIHFGVIVSLWALYREILRHIEPPSEGASGPLHQSPALGFGIAFFALNPAAVYAVAYLIQRSILMATLFSVLALWLFARGLARKQSLHHVLALACYALAVLSKEYAILVPLAAMPVYILIARPNSKRLLVSTVEVALLAAGMGVLLFQRYGEILGKPF